MQSRPQKWKFESILPEKTSKKRGGYYIKIIREIDRERDNQVE